LESHLKGQKHRRISQAAAAKARYSTVSNVSVKSAGSPSPYQISEKNAAVGPISTPPAQTFKKIPIFSGLSYSPAHEEVRKMALRGVGIPSQQKMTGFGRFTHVPPDKKMMKSRESSPEISELRDIDDPTPVQLPKVRIMAVTDEIQRRE